MCSGQSNSNSGQSSGPKPRIQLTALASSRCRAASGKARPRARGGRRRGRLDHSCPRAPAPTVGSKATGRMSARVQLGQRRQEARTRAARPRARPRAAKARARKEKERRERRASIPWRRNGLQKIGPVGKSQQSKEELRTRFTLCVSDSISPRRWSGSFAPSMTSLKFQDCEMSHRKTQLIHGRSVKPIHGPCRTVIHGM